LPVRTPQKEVTVRTLAMAVPMACRQLNYFDVAEMLVGPCPSSASQLVRLR